MLQYEVSVPMIDLVAAFVLFIFMLVLLCFCVATVSGWTKICILRGGYSLVSTGGRYPGGGGANILHSRRRWCVVTEFSTPQTDGQTDRQTDAGRRKPFLISRRTSYTSGLWTPRSDYAAVCRSDRPEERAGYWTGTRNESLPGDSDVILFRGWFLPPSCRSKTPRNVYRCDSA